MQPDARNRVQAPTSPYPPQYKGAACIVATPLPLFSKGRGIKNPLASSDPDAGLYGRQDNHGEPGQIKDAHWAFDVHLVVFVDDTLLYTDQKAEGFQTPAREIGYKPVLGYGPKHHRPQGTHRSGMGLVEGHYLCPAMPDPLADATVLRRSKDKAEKLTHEQYQQAIANREPYVMRTKQKPDTEGKGERLGCPASGPNPLAACELKPASMLERKTRQPNRSVADSRPTIYPPQHVKDAHHDACDKESVTLAPGDGAQYRQEMRYGTFQQHTTYVRLRQSQEAVHGYTKKHAAVAFADPNARRVRGKAAQSLFAAFLLAASSISKIRWFLANAETDLAGDRYVIREPVVSALRTPPGDKSPDEEDPPPEDLAEAA